jgi:hypothetical protein
MIRLRRAKPRNHPIARPFAGLRSSQSGKYIVDGPRSTKSGDHDAKEVGVIGYAQESEAGVPCDEVCNHLNEWNMMLLETRAIFQGE